MSNDVAYPLLFGAVFHEGKAAFYKSGGDLEYALDYMNDELAAVAEMFSMPVELEVARWKLPTLLSEWAEQHGYLDLKAWEVIAVEKSVSATIPGSEHVLTGRVDLIAKLRSTDEYYIIDTKTSSFSIATAEMAAHYGDQATAYIWLVREALGIPVKGFIVDIAYWNKKSNDIKNISFSRGNIVQRSEQSIREFLVGARQLNDEIAAKLEALKGGADPSVFRRNTHYCSAFFKKCEYADICRKNVSTKGRAPQGFARDKAVKPYRFDQAIYDSSEGML